jgi:poly-gamma-glutamate synthase PgsB/CapB
VTSELPRIDRLRERLLAEELAWARSLFLATGDRGLVDAATACLADARAAYARFDDLSRRCDTADARSRARFVATYLREANKDPAELAGDLRALRRGGPGVFDTAALAERLAREVNLLEMRAEACLAVLGALGASTNSSLVGPVLALAETPGRWSRRTEAISWLRKLSRIVVSGYDWDVVVSKLADLTSFDEHRWVQAAALAALATFDGGAAHAIAKERLDRDHGGDDFLVRARITGMVGQFRRTRWLDLLPLAHADASELVRMTAVGVEPSAEVVDRIARTDTSHRVRASAVIRLAKRFPQHAPSALGRALTGDAHGFVVETAADELVRMARKAPSSVPAESRLGLLVASRRADLPAEARNRCADAHVEIDVLVGDARGLLYELSDLVRDTKVGGSTRITRQSLEGIDERQLLSILSVIARDDFGVGVEERRDGWIVHRGERSGFAPWRFLFELSHPSPGKRQGYAHVTGRRLHGRLRAPPGLLAEVTATRVPGERVLSVHGGGWGRHLPLVQDLISTGVLVARSIRIGSAFGVTKVTPPRSFFERLQGQWRLTSRYAHFAALRQQALSSEGDDIKNPYVRDVLRETGILIEIVPYAIDVTAPYRGEQRAWTAPDSVDQGPSISGTALGVAPISLLPATGIVPAHVVRTVWDQITSAALSGEMRLSHLASYATLLLGALVARQMFVRHRLEGHRKKVPLVIGGWGTRGKSGTERLKAAMFQGLGYECLVKTTGCEAMFIHAIPGLRSREVFIYRPYDKATIWEQEAVLALAVRLSARVFLWECMALQPELVNLLQTQWMHDDVSTITNAYPDHEDIQGPTGLDVANTIAEFVPRDSTLVTSELQMLPVLKQSAASRGTRTVVATPRDAELLASDLVARFSYAEHRNNIALVAALARHLGVPPTVAIAEMADHVVADLGALKTYPTVWWRGRSLSFTNGMGANDRTGTLENWRRSGFEDQATRSNPRVRLVTVVNNRADRPARTEVFANVLVNDIAAHHHVLIGTNVAGLLRSIRAALEQHLRELGLTRELPSDAAERRRLVRARLEKAFGRLMVTGADAPGIEAELGALGFPSIPPPLLEGLLHPVAGETYEAAKAAVQKAVGAIFDEEQLPFATAVIAARRTWTRLLDPADTRIDHRPAELETDFASVYRSIFMDSIVVLDDPDLSGDAIIHAVAAAVPRGSDARIMGLQNIKGTGLDFVYRWVSIDSVFRAIADLESHARAVRERALIDLLAHDDYGVIDAVIARKAVEKARTRHPDPSLPYDAILKRLDDIARARGTRLRTKHGTGFSERLRRTLGETLDFVDAARRRRMAARVLDAFSAGRISHATAAIHMRRIVARTKGAWMVPDGYSPAGGGPDAEEI